MGHYIDGKNEANGPVAALYSRSPCCSSVHALSCKRHRDATNLSEVTARRVSTDSTERLFELVAWEAIGERFLGVLGLVVLLHKQRLSSRHVRAVRVCGAEVSLGK